MGLLYTNARAPTLSRCLDSRNASSRKCCCCVQLISQERTLNNNKAMVINYRIRKYITLLQLSHGLPTRAWAENQQFIGVGFCEIANRSTTLKCENFQENYKSLLEETLSLCIFQAFSSYKTFKAVSILSFQRYYSCFKYLIWPLNFHKLKSGKLVFYN